MTDRLLPCPFCGVVPEVEPWHGGAPTKVLIHCDGDDCDVQPSVTGETGKEAAIRWNVRTQAPTEQVSMGHGDALGLAVAAVLRADKEWRAQMPKNWEGDPLSDELDGLRRIFEASTTPAPDLKESE